MIDQSRFGRVSVIGLGYVGLPTAAVLAVQGIDVHGVDIDPAIVETIGKGGCHIAEPGLAATVRAGVASGRLGAGPTPLPADAFLIAVPTPIDADRHADLRFVEAACRSIAPVLRCGNLVILESTSPVGTTEKMTALLASLRRDLTFPLTDPEVSDVLVAYCPERIMPGRTLLELAQNPRTVGGLDMASTRRAIALYRVFCRGRLSAATSRAAELSKLAENAFRDVNIAFANELSMLCEVLGVDVHEVIAAANRHPRVDILQPGPGVGGHCIPVDSWFIVEASPDHARLIRTGREVNDRKTARVHEQIRTAAGAFESPRIAFLGLTYKPDVDDLRESPALGIVRRCADDGLGELMVVEPNLRMLPEALREARVRKVTLDTALASADVVIVLVAHSAFRSLSAGNLTGKMIIDTVGMLRDG